MNKLFLFEITYGEDVRCTSFRASIAAKDVIDAYNKFREIDNYKKTADIYSINRQIGNEIYV